MPLDDSLYLSDEYGDLVTTFMHKAYGTAIQLYHVGANYSHSRACSSLSPLLLKAYGGAVDVDAMMPLLSLSCYKRHAVLHDLLLLCSAVTSWPVNFIQSHAERAILGLWIAISLLSLRVSEHELMMSSIEECRTQGTQSPPADTLYSSCPGVLRFTN